MPDKEFVEEQVYFRVVFPDTAQSIPVIQSFVFIGENLSDEDLERTLYFQFADGFAASGSILNSSGGDRRVACIRDSEISDMMSVEELSQALVEARNRRSSGA